MNRKLIFETIIPFFVVSLLITSCGRSAERKKEQEQQTAPKILKPSLNIMILLDLSDRLIQEDGQSSRDKELIKHICSEIPNIIIKNNGVDKSKEMIKIQIADQDKIQYSTRQYSDSLYFKMSRDIRGGIPAVRKILQGQFNRNLDHLYEEAVFSDKPEDYHGANISRYFIRDLNNDVKRDSMTNNLLFILTDGYIVVGQENNAMLDVHNKFPELKVMVLEISPRNQDYESERLQQSWDRWFAQMEVQGYALRYIGPTQAIKEDITKFLQGTLELTVPGKIAEQIPEKPKPVPLEDDLKASDKKKGTDKTTQSQATITQPSITPPPPPPPPPQNTITLQSGDIYVGETLNGRPNGLGILTFKASRIICDGSNNSQRAEAGDKLKGTWRNGILQMGRLYTPKDSLKFTIICGGE